MFLDRKMRRPRKVQEGEIFFKLCECKLYSCDLYINLPNFFGNRNLWTGKTNDVMSLFTLFRNMSFFYWFVWEFRGDCSWASCSGWTFLLVARYFLLVACNFLLFARYFLLVAHFFLLVGFCSLIVARYFLLVAR